MKENKPFPKNRARTESRHPQKIKPSFVNKDEMKYYGFYACLKLWKERPDDIIRVYVDEKRVKEAASLLKWCATKAKAYHVISEAEMAKVSDSTHHEGLCILAKQKKVSSFNEVLESFKKNSDPACLLYLDGVQNPHNVGSIMRVSAHFGIKYILGQKDFLPKISPSSYRIAQGGAEFVELVPIDDVKSAFQKLEDLGFKIATTSSHGKQSLYNYKFQKRTLIVMGGESEGIDRKLLDSSKDTLTIPGSNLVESLNVSVATGLLLGEYYRQIQAK